MGLVYSMWKGGIPGHINKRSDLSFLFTACMLLPWALRASLRGSQGGEVWAVDILVSTSGLRHTDQFIECIPVLSLLRAALGARLGRGRGELSKRGIEGIGACSSLSSLCINCFFQSGMIELPT